MHGIWNCTSETSISVETTRQMKKVESASVWPQQLNISWKLQCHWALGSDDSVSIEWVFAETMDIFWDCQCVQIVVLQWLDNPQCGWDFAEQHHLEPSIKMPQMGSPRVWTQRKEDQNFPTSSLMQPSLHTEHSTTHPVWHQNHWLMSLSWCDKIGFDFVSDFDFALDNNSAAMRGCADNTFLWHSSQSRLVWLFQTWVSCSGAWMMPMIVLGDWLACVSASSACWAVLQTACACKQALLKSWLNQARHWIETWLCSAVDLPSSQCRPWFEPPLSFEMKLAVPLENSISEKGLWIKHSDRIFE